MTNEEKEMLEKITIHFKQHDLMSYDRFHGIVKRWEERTGDFRDRCLKICHDGVNYMESDRLRQRDICHWN